MGTEGPREQGWEGGSRQEVALVFKYNSLAQLGPGWAQEQTK